MSSKESEYQELFRAEALENFEELNKLFTVLEKNHSDRSAIDSIFRITHTLKGNAMGIGLTGIGELAHVMEDIFGEVKQGGITLDSGLFDSLFSANDKLGALIQVIGKDTKVSYLGVKTKLSVILRKAKEEQGDVDTPIEDQKETALQPKETVQHQQEDSDEEEQPNSEDAPKIAFSDVVQIPIRKLDDLMNQVGQLIIERDRLIAVSTANGSRVSEFEGLQRISSDLQYGVMDVRLEQVGFLFNKFHRIVRDVANIEGKTVNLELKGTDIEIDRNILKVISDSLIHLVRNAVSHGIEDDDLRKKSGKKEAGTVTLNARYERDSVVIEVSDNGNGIDANVIRKKIVEKEMVREEVAKNLPDQDVIMYIFEPGFSNAEVITEVSGRGVGMDVVKKATESIGGQVLVDTELGKGSTIKLLLPSSMTLKGALLFEIDHQEFAIPLSYTEAVVSLYKKDIRKINGGLVSQYLDKTISVAFLKDLFKMKNLSEIYDEGVLHTTYDLLTEDQKIDVIIVTYGGKLIGIAVDKLLQQKEILEKNLSKPLDKIKLLSGSTILGNGNVCPIVDAISITETLFKAAAMKKAVS